MIRLPILVVVGLAMLVPNTRVARAQSDDADLLEDLGPAPEPEEEEPIVDEPIEEVEATEVAPEKKPEPAAATVEEEATSPAAQDRIKAVPRKPVLKRGRFELAAFGATSVNDAFWQHLAISGSAIYYPHDSFGIGLGVDYLFAHAPTANVDVVRESLISVPVSHEKPRLFAHLDLFFVPVYGKISLFDTQIVHFELYGSAGIGMKTSFDQQQQPMVNAAIGQRFFIADWLAVRFEVRDHLFLESMGEKREELQSDVQSYVMFLLGASFYLPPSFEYSYR